MTQNDLQQSVAATAAARNYQLNLNALRSSQPDLATTLTPAAPQAEWLLARDGSLTARTAGAWWSGCSLPLRAAQTLLEKLDLSAAVSCFLSPTHAAQLRVILDRLCGGKSFIAVVPEPVDLRFILACDSFEAAIGGGRLWFVTGQHWDDDLEQLLIANDGLPIPGQFVRTTLVEAEQLNEMIRVGQGVFSREINRRAQAVRTFLTTPRTAQSGRVCVIAPSVFRLWEDAGGVLKMIADGQNWQTIDPDDSRQASPVTFARAAAGCEAVVLIDASRADLPAELASETKVITWLTGVAIPRFVPHGVHDRLFIADPQRRAAAIAAGWPGDRIMVATWPAGWHGQVYSPARDFRDDQGTGKQAGQPERVLSIIANTIAIPSPDFELSSQNILWESIRRHITDDPFVVGPDVNAYLRGWLTSAGIGDEAVDHAAFVQRLILPAYQQGLARWLIRGNIKLRLFGRGWGDIEEFAPHHLGEIDDRAALHRAIESSAALVHVWPANGAHPIDATGRPVLRRASRSKELWLTEAKRLARVERHPPSNTASPLSAELICRAAGLTQPS
ncbi:MAG: hypothetical protein JWN40_3966 [Phycisphaerales bacterium]|nr:hypothetical protein [Phycisphaerales bacterium]